MKRFTDRDIKILENRHFGASHVIPPARKPMDHEESRIQQEVIAWWHTVSMIGFGVPEIVLFAIPNAGRRGPALGKIMKREGLRAGVADLFLSVARGRYHGLYIEMKKPDGIVSPSQRKFLAEANKQGYAAFACYSFDQAVKFIADYLSGEEFF